MTDCFPEMVMPPPEPTPEEKPLPLTDDVIQKQLDIEEAEQDDYEVEELSDEEVVPEPKRRPKISQEEIFSKEVPKVKTILQVPEDPPIEKPKGRTKSGVGTRKKRGPATPEQLERLARGRIKAQETRERKKKEKEERLKKEKEDKELVEALRERERLKLKKRLETPIEEEDKPVPQVKVVEKDRIIEKGYSQKDLDDAVQRAVEQSVNRVETLRKQRKEAKAKALAKQKHDAKVFQEVNRALKNDVWANCFL